MAFGLRQIHIDQGDSSIFHRALAAEIRIGHGPGSQILVASCYGMTGKRFTATDAAIFATSDKSEILILPSIAYLAAIGTSKPTTWQVEQEMHSR